MAQTLGNVAVGAIVKLNENGSPVEYLVIQQGKPRIVCTMKAVMEHGFYGKILPKTVCGMLMTLTSLKTPIFRYG